MDDSAPLITEFVLKAANYLLTGLFIWLFWWLFKLHDLTGKQLSYFQALGIALILGVVINGQLWIYDRFH